MQVLRLMPYLSRVADLYQREHLLTNPTDRINLQNLSHLVGSALR